MIAKAIENWLTNTNERNYLTPYCEVLLQKGHRIINISKHAVLEQGKDLITINANGEFCAYQLKTGDINIVEWRKIYGEIIELIEIPISHPSFNKKSNYKSFLVTNGEITDAVRTQINQINESNLIKNRNCSYLDIINGKTLLKEFIDSQNFFPKEVEDFDSFLNIYLSEGEDFLEKDKFFNFFTEIIFKKDLSKTEATIAINSSIIINSYLLKQYQIKNNYFSLFEAWILLASCIITFAKAKKLQYKKYISSFLLAFEESLNNLSNLKNETLERKDFLEGDIIFDGGFIYDARVTLLLGSLSAFELYSLKKIKNEDDAIITLIKNNIDRLAYWGESAFPLFFYIIKYLEIKNEIELADRTLNRVFSQTLALNTYKGDIGLIPNPYYNINDILINYVNKLLKFEKESIDFNQFAGGSYVLESIVTLLSKRNKKELLTKFWRQISHFNLYEFEFDRIDNYFTYRSKKGSLAFKYFNETQSWNELVGFTNNYEDVPSILKENTELLLFFIIVCPHRVNSKAIKLLDSII